MFMALRRFGLARQAKGALSPNDPDAVSKLKLSVWLTDLDAFLHMTNTRYFELMDIASPRLLRRNGLATRAKDNGVEFLPAYANLDVHSMLKLSTKYELRSHMVGADDEFVAIGHTFHSRGRSAADGTVIYRLNRTNDTPVERATLGLEDCPYLPDEMRAWAVAGLTSGVVAT